MDRTFITLRQDNGACNPPGLGTVTVTTDKNTLEHHIKRVLGWRSATKRYNSIIERYRAAGSHSYDRVILSIYEGVKRKEKEMEKEMEKTATYIVMTSNGKDEWILYEGTDLWEAGRIARLETRTNQIFKQNYTVELREMVNEYDYELIEFDKVTWHDLNENNLRFSYYNGDGTSDLEFKVKGKTVFVRNVMTPEDADEWYWDDKVLTRELANIDPDRIEVQKG